MLGGSREPRVTGIQTWGWWEGLPQYERLRGRGLGGCSRNLHLTLLATLACCCFPLAKLNRKPRVRSHGCGLYPSASRGSLLSRAELRLDFSVKENEAQGS